HKKQDQSSGESDCCPACGIDQNEAPVRRNVIGIRTFFGVPALKRQRRNALSVEPSKIGLPMLCSMVALTTLPFAGSTVSTATPLPVICRLRAHTDIPAAEQRE